MQPFSLIRAEDRALMPRTAEDAYPVGALQADLFLRSADAAGDLFMLHMNTAYDHGALHTAVEHAVARHDILRTSFHFAGYSRPLQLVHRSAGVRTAVTDLRPYSRAEQQDYLDVWREQELGTPYDWTDPPLMRISVHVLGDHEFLFCPAFHEALLDSWSESSLITEILADYWAGQGGSPRSRPAPRPARRFAECIAREEAALSDPAVTEFWSTELAGTEPMFLPVADRGLSDGCQTCDTDTATAGFLGADLDPAVCAELAALARHHRTGLRQVLLAVHARVLASLIGREEVVLAVESDGRSEDGGEGTDVIGVRLDVLFYRLRTADADWSGLIRAVLDKEHELRTVGHCPYPEVQRLAGPREPTDIAFAWSQFRSFEELLAATDVESLDAKAHLRTGVTLRVSFTEDCFTGLLSLDLEADLRKVGEEQLCAIGEMYRNAVAALVADARGVAARGDVLGER
ncbi:condensation domain-containing protein [Streptomyces sp. NPDC001262]|uniref:condensation domain-containing protein n=1 Tax=Streptomyces sp. NPDC001262 TaxID=3364552 RepID=UPI0036774423